MGKGRSKGTLYGGFMTCMYYVYAYRCRGRHITSKGQKDLDQIAGQVRETRGGCVLGQYSSC